MASLTSGFDRNRFSDAREFLRRRLSELAGGGLFLVSIVLFLVFATYDPSDPSWNSATDKVPANFGGETGAILADILLQTVGYAGLLVPMVLLVWALRLLLNLPIRQLWLRTLLLPALMLTSAISLGILPNRAGGVIGAFTWSHVHLGDTGALVGAALAAVNVLILIYVMGLSRGEWLRVGKKAGRLAKVGRVGGKAVVSAGVNAGGRIQARSVRAWRERRPTGGNPASAKSTTNANATAASAAAQRALREPPIKRRDPQEPSFNRGIEPSFGPATPAPAAPVEMPQPAPAAAIDEAFDEDAPPAFLTRRPAATASVPSAISAERAAPPAPMAHPAPAAHPAPTAQAQPVQPAPVSASTSISTSAQPDPVRRESPRPSGVTGMAVPRGIEYDLPPHDLLALAPAGVHRGVPSEEALQQNALALLSVLEDFGVRGEIVKVRPGPVVTLYELEPAPGTKSARVIGLADDIARSMSAVSVRVAVVPGRNVIGIELPNPKSETVYLRELLASDAYERTQAKLTMVLGKDIGGAPVVADLAKMPHLLIAGTTGSGKSVGINTMILSILYRMPPDQCKFIMIDPKMLELSIYDGIPHLLTPVVTDPKKAVVALKWTVREMENRYRLMSKLGVRNIEGYNARLSEALARGESLARRVQTGFDPETGEPQFEEQPLDSNPLPFIVVVVDEMADLMLVAGKDIEAAIQRLAQMARAAGIHIVTATQRPSVDVITGTIKANFPTRISFQVTSKIDSRTILGEAGAEQLLGRGDMLYMAGGGRITRVHGPFVSDGEVESVVNFLKSQGSPDYIDEVTEDEGGGEIDERGGGSGGGGGDDASDDLYDRAVALVTRERKASTSFVQRHLQIGYNRAARIIERMEQEGVVGQANHVGKREVLAPPPPRQ